MAYAPPFPWFGGKSRVADLVWQRFGEVKNYVEPFFGSGAVLFLRPHEPGIETINDLDCYVANFWRALQAAPDEVARWADWPVNEADLHARHWWLVNQSEFREKMHSDPDHYDAKIAGWWVWGICQWIGSGWCAYPEWQQLPHLGNPGMGDLYAYLHGIAARLRGVRVCCGDWSRVLGPSPTIKLGTTGVFLDPPYSHEVRDTSLYAVEMSVADGVRDWAIEHGDDPLLRIALCGYENEHEMPDTWECVAWKSAGGYASQASVSNENCHNERIWFSPHCLGVEPQPVQGVLL